MDNEENVLVPCDECGALLTCEHKGEWLFGN
jgi:hypothetical protein